MPCFLSLFHTFSPSTLRPDPVPLPQPDVFPWVEEDKSYSDSITQERCRGLPPRVLESPRITDIRLEQRLASSPRACFIPAGLHNPFYFLIYKIFITLKTNKKSKVLQVCYTTFVLILLVLLFWFGLYCFKTNWNLFSEKAHTHSHTDTTEEMPKRHISAVPRGPSR